MTSTYEGGYLSGMSDSNRYSELPLLVDSLNVDKYVEIQKKKNIPRECSSKYIYRGSLYS